MKKRLNLLPDAFVMKVELYRDMRKAIAITAIVFFILILIVMALRVSISNINESMREIDAKYESEVFEESENILRQLREKGAEVSEIEAIMDLLKVPDNIRTEHIKLIKDSATSGLVIRDINANNAASSIILNVEVRDRDEIVIFIEKLNALEIFKKVELSELWNIENITNAIVSVGV